MSLRFKRHYNLVVLLMLLSAVLILGLGDQRIVAYSVPSDIQIVNQDGLIAQTQITGLLSSLGIH